MPERTCVGCREKKEIHELIRFTCYNGVMSFDPKGRKPGRGAYLCGSPDCLENAIKKNGFSRTFKTKVSEDAIRGCYQDYISSLED